MVLGFIIILSIIGTLLALSMYANLLPFVGLLGDVKQYNVAYYGAQSAIERSLLVLRTQDAWFQWEWWIVDGEDPVWPVSDKFTTTGTMWPFGQAGEMYRSIDGRWVTVPLSWWGNIPHNLLSGESNDFNMLWYGQLEKIFLRYDASTSTGAYYNDSVDKHTYVFLSGDASDDPNISLAARVNPVIFEMLNGGDYDGYLDTDMDIDGDWLTDDVALDRSWRGNYDDGSQSWSFHILPKSRVSYVDPNNPEVLSWDEFIRESILNAPIDYVAIFGWISNSFNPTAGITVEGLEERQDGSSHLLISDNDDLTGVYFTTLLSTVVNPEVFFQILELSLINPLWTIWDGVTNKSIYPFLEYQIQCSVCEQWDGKPQFAQPYFTVHGQAKVGEYEVKMQLQRSASDDSAIAWFTVIF